MASGISSVSMVSRGTSVRNRVKSYYKTEVITLATGGTQRTTFRTDKKGDNAVQIQQVVVDTNNTIASSEISSNATSQEVKDLNNVDSKLRTAIKNQTQAAGNVARKNDADAAGGGLTDAGRKNVEVAGGGSGNTANDEDSTNVDSSAVSELITLENEDMREGTRNRFPGAGDAGGLRYPLDLAEQTQDFLRIEMVEYQPRGFGPGEGTALGLTPDRLPPGPTIGRITLPIAAGIKDVNAVEFGNGNMNVLEAESAFLALGIINDGVEGFTSAAESISGRIQTNKGSIQNALTAFFAGAATGTGQQVLQRAAGAVFNPNLELLFKGPSLRPFNFTYKMSARSKEEGDQIIQIIRMLKQGMAPRRTASNLFLKTPHTFRLRYIQNGADHKFLNKFKECALQSLQVEYAPEGTYATFSDGKMVSYQISMTFQELEPVFNDDYENDSVFPTEIGF